MCMRADLDADDTECAYVFLRVLISILSRSVKIRIYDMSLEKSGLHQFGTVDAGSRSNMVTSDAMSATGIMP